MPSPRVIAVQFDGLRADALSEENTPNLLAAAGRGTWFRNHRSAFPASTRVCVSSLATGVHPRKHGLPGNSFLAPELGEIITTERARSLIAWEKALGGRPLPRDALLRRIEESASDAGRVPADEGLGGSPGWRRRRFGQDVMRRRPGNCRRPRFA